MPSPHLLRDLHPLLRDLHHLLHDLLYASSIYPPALHASTIGLHALHVYSIGSTAHLHLVSGIFPMCKDRFLSDTKFFYIPAEL